MEIRLANKQDAKQIRDIYKYYVQETTITFEYDVPSLEEMENRITQTLINYPYYVALVDQKIVGYAYAGVYKNRAAYQWGCELSVYVDHKEHGRGIATHLYDCLIAELKSMRFQKLYACIALPNEKSVSFHQKYGFQQNALFKNTGYKFNQWIDMIWMEKTLNHDLNPETPLWMYLRNKEK